MYLVSWRSWADHLKTLEMELLLLVRHLLLVAWHLLLLVRHLLQVNFLGSVLGVYLHVSPG